mmetsp:Transcript_24629/g.37948  ORF Transcript_24629/g.37948 Transcript_24629/m.37948 type:complete len:274 (-) Transcript_24629:144-965(-)|eukprot:CAMPEP_0195282984 /NCGR_PEP_ID=MMETSP0707-20130614/1684_1 /TAXON_ID=33640 /ORGANISM="Asterionellopsis glacialis, Strain CCMP134" /LENGTH=273 /DNA_ID=CAMNT_0040342077 /DNA_START=193 /DNA_END=1014 /DNA_ORIENTATION=-
MAQRVLLTRFLTRQASSFQKLQTIRPKTLLSPPSLSRQVVVNRSSSLSSSSVVSSRWFHSTPLKADNKKDDTQKDTPKETKKKGEEDDDDDDVPVYQNPLHHENVEYTNDNKMYPEDFENEEDMPVVPLPPLETGEPGEIPASPELHALAEDILQLNILEMNELVTGIADHFGFEDDGAMMDMGGGGGAGGAAAEDAAPVEEKTAFDLKLTGFDKKAKIKVIKEVRAMSGLGLKEAKELVEGAPKVVKKDMKKEEAEELKAKLEAVGATVELA